MSALSAITQGRQSAEAGMLDDCRITRGGGATTIDPATGLPVEGDDTTVYSGKCKVQSADLQVASPVSGDHVYAVQRFTVHIPVAADDVEVGDVVEVTASPTDPAQIGRKFRVAGLFRKTLATAQRLSVEEVTA